MQSFSDNNNQNQPQISSLPIINDENSNILRPPPQMHPRRRSHDGSGKQLQSSSKGIAKKIVDLLLWGIDRMVKFVSSMEFTLRVAEILSIVVICRYNNIYSFVAVVWLAAVASIDRSRVIYLITLVVLLPVELLNFTLMYGFNVPDSPFADWTG